MTSVISALDCQLETNTGRQTELSYIIKKNPDEIKILAPCLVMIGLPCSSVAHSLCKKRKKRKKKCYSCTGTMTFNIPHHSAAPLRPVSDYKTWLSLEKNKKQTSSHKQPVKLFRSRCTAPCWVNMVTHRHTHTLQSLHCFFFPVADIFPSAPLSCCCFLKLSFLTRSDDDVNNNPVRRYNPERSTFGSQTPSPSVLFLWCF